MIGLVVAHHHDNFDFIEEWRDEIVSNDVIVYICYDRDIEVPTIPIWLKDKVKVFTRKDIADDLKTKSWIIPFGTSAIKSYGFYKAWQDKCSYIITVDNDCFPDRSSGYFIKGHVEKLQKKVTLDWVKSTTDAFLLYKSRGFPYKIREQSDVYVNHGLWSKIPDLDAAQMLMMPNLRTQPTYDSIVIPRYNFYPMCGMNLAFKPEVAPLMYFGLFGEKYGFDQFDDIWAGVFSKKVMDYFSWAVTSGYPSVEHRKQSNAFLNFRKQAGGLELNENLWKEVQKIQLTKDNPVDCYQEILDKLDYKVIGNDWYFKKCISATTNWLNLFRNE
jgi:Reversibly glycosylated polypeptide